VLPGGLDLVRLRDDLLRKVLLGNSRAWRVGVLRIIKWLRRTRKYFFPISYFLGSRGLQSYYY